MRSPVEIACLLQELMENALQIDSDARTPPSDVPASALSASPPGPMVVEHRSVIKPFSLSDVPYTIERGCESRKEERLSLHDSSTQRVLRIKDASLYHSIGHLPSRNPASP